MAALSVLVWHYGHFAYIAYQSVDLVTSRLPLYGLLRPFYEAGNYGVWVFWCVSGFIFFWKYRDAISNRSVSGWKFFVFRFSRLYPLHLVTLIIVAVLQSVYFRQQGYFFVYRYNDLEHFLLQVFMASNWGLLELGDSFNGPIWSVSIEVLTYVVFFVMLRYVTKSALVNFAVVLVYLSLGGEFFSCLAFFYAGGLAAIARRTFASTTFSGAIENAAWSAVAILPILAWASGLPFRHVIDWVFMPIYIPIVLFCLSREIALPAPAQRLLEAAANMTYSSYLAQFPIQLLIVLAFAKTGRPIPLYDDWFFGMFVSSTLLISYVTYRYFESPVQKFLRGYLLPSIQASRTVLVGALARLRRDDLIICGAANAGGECIANHPRCIYKHRIVARTREICMISSYSQIAPAYPMLLLDAWSLTLTASFDRD